MIVPAAVIYWNVDGLYVEGRSRERSFLECYKLSNPAAYSYCKQSKTGGREGLATKVINQLSSNSFHTLVMVVHTPADSWMS